MSKGKNKSESGLHIDGGVNITNGDLVAGDKIVKENKEGVFVEGNVQNSKLAGRDQNSTENVETIRDELFTELIRKIDQLSNVAPDDQEDLKANVEEIRVEADKGDEADESFISRRLRNIKRIAPDIAEVVVAALSNPMAGFATIVKKIAERAQESTAK